MARTWKRYYLFKQGSLVKTNRDNVTGINSGNPQDKVGVKQGLPMIYLYSSECEDKGYFDIPCHTFICDGKMISIARDDDWFELCGLN